MYQDESGAIDGDGFETGDYRNFAPVYLGTQSDWVRPTVAVTNEEPIAGEYSLRWSADEDPHRWTLVSNAFYLAAPLTVSLKLRVDGPAGETFAAGLGIAETPARATVARATENGLELATDAWDGEPAAAADVALTRGEQCDLVITLEDGDVTATISDAGGERARLRSETTVEPNALGLYVDTVAGGETILTFDDVTVESAPYRVRNDEWVRSPEFVVLPRAPDTGEDQGNWVGAPTIIDEGDRYRMWYRIRNNEERGAGYGLAESHDGIDWEKRDDNPILVPDHGQDSNEGISVLAVDGTYHAWYTMDKDGTWHIVHATSDDGVDWTDHGIVIEGYCKDPSVVFVGGTYYLYAIGPTNTEFSIYTSDDGAEWTHRNTIELGAHGHPGAYYEEATGTFWLYAFAEEGSASPAARVRRGASEDGIEFDDLEPTWHDPPVGLDHRPTGGIDYGAFPGDGHRHLPDDRRVPMYYQARHDYRNNRPSWRMAGDGMVVLGGRFRGLFEGVSTTVTEEGYAYHEFPMHAAPVRGLDVAADAPTRVVVEEWSSKNDPVGLGTIETTAETTLSVRLTRLEPGTEYVFRLGDGESLIEADNNGTTTFEVTVPPNVTREFLLSETHN